VEKLAPAGGAYDDRATMERRQRRVAAKPDALTLFLESQRRRLDVRALTVATRDGRLIAGAGEAPARVAQAAIAVDEARGGVADAAEPLATWRLRAGGVEVVLASLGGRLSYDVGSGVRRILG
jgi:hypothetical protein